MPYLATRTEPGDRGTPVRGGALKMCWTKPGPLGAGSLRVREMWGCPFGRFNNPGVARRRQVAEAVGSGSHLTPRWREMDSNFRFPYAVSWNRRFFSLAVFEPGGRRAGGRNSPSRCQRRKFLSVSLDAPVSWWLREQAKESVRIAAATFLKIPPIIWVIPSGGDAFLSFPR
jgi:hypothetical protein